MKAGESLRLILRETEALKAAPAARVHLFLKRDNPVESRCDVGRLPRPCGEQDQRVEDLLVQARRVLQSVMPALDRGGQSSAEPGIQCEMTPQMGEAEGDVPGLVLGREAGAALLDAREIIFGRACH